MCPTRPCCPEKAFLANDRHAIRGSSGPLASLNAVKVLPRGIHVCGSRKRKRPALSVPNLRLSPLNGSLDCIYDRRIYSAWDGGN
jgi:hypothetical protein